MNQTKIRDKQISPSIFRFCTAPWRRLPDFLIIGAQKAGTSSLYYSLIKHPCVYPASRKEIHFFSWYYHRGLSWYQAHFPIKRESSRAFLTLEASTEYLFQEQAPTRILSHLPNVKLIALLRNPVDRAFSNYRMEMRSGRERLSFEEVLEREDQIQQAAGYQDKYYWDYSYKARGRYLEQLLRWHKYFKKENILIINSEEFLNNTAGVYKQVLEFLNLPAYRPKEFQRHQVATDNLTMKPGTRAMLLEYFKPYNQRLFEYLGRRFDWEKQTNEH